MSKFMLRVAYSNVPSYNPGDLLPADTPLPVVLAELIEVPDDTAPAVFARAGVATVAGEGVSPS